MGVREDIKTIIVQSNWTITEVAQEMTQITGKTYSRSNISQKLTRKTLKYEEAMLIGQILGYDLKFIKK
ncbi:MAG TPA: phosphoribosylglycinamide formyltransferase [Cyanobacteria bacterium UBA9971]|nr:phosphoribosylglycinamide formyltransferase [Cyanobacteria bacterium UBA9971]